MANRRPYHEYETQNPLRSPSWRWDRAQDLVRHGRYYSKKRDDPQTGEAVRYLRARRRGEYHSHSSGRTKRYSDLHVAHGIFTENGLRQLEVQSRVLARQTTSEIADAMSMPPGGIKGYKEVFFDLHGCIDATAYINHAVIGMPPAGPPPLPAFVKAQAYFRGPQVLEALLDYVSHRGEEHDLTRAEGRRRAWIELDLAARSLPDDPKTAQKLLKIGDLIFDLPSKPSQTRTVDQVLAERAAEIVDLLPLEHFQERFPNRPDAGVRVRSGEPIHSTSQITEAA